MTRAALEHILHAAAALANERDFVVIGIRVLLREGMVDASAVGRRLDMAMAPASRVSAARRLLTRIASDAGRCADD